MKLYLHILRTPKRPDPESPRVYLSGLDDSQFGNPGMIDPFEGEILDLDDTYGKGDWTILHTHRLEAKLADEKMALARISRLLEEDQPDSEEEGLRRIFEVLVERAYHAGLKDKR